MFDQRSVRDEAPLGAATAFLGTGASVNGTLAFDGPAQIEGRVEGAITARDTLTIGRSAVIEATITGATVIVHGHVTGDVTASARLEILAGGRIDGDVSAPVLVVQEGAALSGRCTMDAASRPSATMTVESVPLAPPAAAAAPSASKAG